MSSTFMILALAGSALAVPFHGENAHWRHRQMNHFFPSGIAHTGTGAPYGLANATGIYGATGTAASTGFPVAVASDYASLTTQVAAVPTSTSTTCIRSTVYVTTTNRITLTLQANGTATATTASEEAEETAAADETEEDASEDDATATLNARKIYEGKQRWRSTSAAVSTVAATSVYVATSASSAVATSKTSSAAAAASSSTASSGSGKRGVAYNDASLTAPFVGAKEVTWGYNWGQSSTGLSTSLNFVPLLWGTSSTFTSGWAASVKAAAANGNTHLMAFNEPDLNTQSNLTPEAAAAAYKTYMQPYAGQFKLGAPAVTNGAGAMGLNWLDAFLKACDGCTIDFVSVHWYESASNTEYFKSHISNATTVAGGRPVWVTEFGCTSGSDAEVSTFLETVMPWMDSQSYIERYSYFMVADGVLVSGGKPTAYGNTYMNYTS